MERNKDRNNILVLGAGNFGTCLAQHLATLGYKPTLYTRSSSLAESINEKNLNFKHLSEFKLHSEVKATASLSDEILSQFIVVILAVPTQFLRESLEPIKESLRNKTLVCVSKGIEIETLCLPSDILLSIFGEEVKKRAAYLSGPSFAVEIMERQPTAVTVASFNPQLSEFIQKLFHSPRFRVYLSEDPVGVEIAGALKNVMAIAAGACYGLGFKSNTLAALVTRGLAEISRIGISLGANSLTFKGLAGIGDLMLTCSSQKSRNFHFGSLLAGGRTVLEAQEELGSVAEGVATTKSAYLLSKKLGVRAAIIHAVYSVLYESSDLEKAVEDLLSSSAKSELE